MKDINDFLISRFDKLDNKVDLCHQEVKSINPYRLRSC
jgi:hypothetical protein